MSSNELGNFVGTSHPSIAYLWVQLRGVALQQHPWLVCQAGRTNPKLDDKFLPGPRCLNPPRIEPTLKKKMQKIFIPLPDHHKQ